MWVWVVAGEEATQDCEPAAAGEEPAEGYEQRMEMAWRVAVSVKKTRGDEESGRVTVSQVI